MFRELKQGYLFYCRVRFGHTLHYSQTNTEKKSERKKKANRRRRKMRIESMGKRALFLIPSVKVYNRKYSKKKQRVFLKIHRANLCADIIEECIYLECGEDAMLVYP